MTYVEATENQGVSKKVIVGCSVAFFIVGMAVSGSITANWYKAKSSSDKARIAALEQAIRGGAEFDKQAALSDAPGDKSAALKTPTQTLAVKNEIPPAPTLHVTASPQRPVVVADVVKTPEQLAPQLERQRVEAVTAAVNNTTRIDASPNQKSAAKTVQPPKTTVASVKPPIQQANKATAIPVVAKVLPPPVAVRYSEEEMDQSSRRIARLVAPDPDSNAEATIVNKPKPREQIGANAFVQGSDAVGTTGAAGGKASVKPGPAYRINDAAVVNVAEIERNNKVEGVSASRVGVKQLTDEGVVVRNGDQIKIGERFPSGERLLRVDPGASKIVTDQRTILLL